MEWVDPNPDPDPDPNPNLTLTRSLAERPKMDLKRAMKGAPDEVQPLPPPPSLQPRSLHHALGSVAVLTQAVTVCDQGVTVRDQAVTRVLRL